MEDNDIRLNAQELEQDWRENQRWASCKRTYSGQEVEKLRPTVPVRYTLAEIGAKKFWELLHKDSYTNALGAITGSQAVNMVKGGLKAIYLSGWQVAADGNLSGQTY